MKNSVVPYHGEIVRLLFRFSRYSRREDHLSFVSWIFSPRGYDTCSLCTDIPKGVAFRFGQNYAACLLSAVCPRGHERKAVK